MGGKEKNRFGSLQNGSDVRGVAMAGVDGEPVRLTGEGAYCIGKAFALWLSEAVGKTVQTVRVGLGRDSRLTGPALLQSALQGIADAGAQGFDCGMASTPAMFMSTQFPQTDFDGAVMVTASHLPFHRNGLKFFTKTGGLGKEEVKVLLEMAEQQALPEHSAQTLSQNVLENTDKSAGEKTVALLAIYSAFLREKITGAVKNGEKPLSALHIVVDAGNGAGGFFATQVLEPLGANVEGSQFLSPDGMFPNHIPNPEDKTAMASIQKAVVEAKADLGLIFDTDVDRMSAVLGDGSSVNRDAIIALSAAIAAQTCPGGTIVTDSVTSHTLTAFLEDKLGLRHHRFKRGYKNVIDECRRLNEQGTPSPLAIETSGHGAFRENFYLDDGAYMAVKIVIAAAVLQKEGKTLAHLLEGYAPAFESREYRLKLLTADFSAYGQQVLETFAQRAKEQGLTVVPNSYEGVRLVFAEPDAAGWALLRLSLHDPLMPLNLEGDGEGHCDRILAVLRRLLAGFGGLDTTSLAQ